MKKALILKNNFVTKAYISDWKWKETKQEYRPIFTEIENCIDLSDLVEPGAEFEVHSNLMWVDAPDDCVFNSHWYYKDGQIFELPIDLEMPETPPAV